MKDILNKVVTEALKNMMKSFIFYFPKELIDYLKLSGEEWIHKAQGKLFFIDKDGDFIDVDQNTKMDIVPKLMLLNENIFVLYNLKDKYGVESFNYIIEKYGELIEFFLVISEWLNNNTTKDILSLQPNQLTYFNLQHDAFLKHKQEFSKRFNNQTLPFDRLNKKTERKIIEKIQALFPKVNFTKEITGEIISPATIQSTTSNKRFDKRKRLKKLKTDTEIIANKYVLKNVFSVKI